MAMDVVFSINKIPECINSTVLWNCAIFRSYNHLLA